MMGAETIAIATLAITAASAAAGGYAQYTSAQNQNRAIRKSRESAKRSADAQVKQLAAAASLEKQKRIDEATRLRGRLRVAAASADVGLSGSYDALDRQAVVDSLLNTEIINTNLGNQIANVESGLAADFTRLDAGVQNAILSGFTGALAGANSGLAIGGNARTITQ